MHGGEALDARRARAPRRCRRGRPARGRCAAGRRSSRSRRGPSRWPRARPRARRPRPASTPRGRVPLIGRVSTRVAVEAQEALGRRRGDHQVAEPQVGGEGRRVDRRCRRAKRSSGVRRAGSGAVKPLREVGLEDVAGQDVLDHPAHGRLVGVAGDLGRHGRGGGGSGRRRQRRGGGEAARPRGPGAPAPARGARGRVGLGEAAREDRARAARRGRTPRRRRRASAPSPARPCASGRRARQPAPGARPELVAEVADGAAVEGRQAGHGRDCGWRASSARSTSSGAPGRGHAVDRHDAVAGDEDPERLDRDERVAPARVGARRCGAGRRGGRRRRPRRRASGSA